MGGLIEIASAILAESQQRVDVAAQNIANMETPGYKRTVAFAALLDMADSDTPDVLSVPTRTDFAQGGLTNTGSPLDLAISGAGFFALRQGDRTVWSRQGAFALYGSGHLVRSDGAVLEADTGGDLVLKAGAFVVAADGTVTQAGQEVGRIGLSEADNPGRLQPVSGGFSAPAGVTMNDVARPVIHQGMLEASNVSNGQEMAGIIEASRRAEVGQKLVQVYDELLGRVFSAFGGGG